MRNAILALVLLVPGRALSQSGWQIEAGVTLPYNFPSPLAFYQNAQPEIDLNARYRSEPLVVPICWVWRIGYWLEGRGWEIEAIHHKIILENSPSEVSSFQVTHGFNIVAINRAWLWGDYTVRVGAGIILAHPEGVIRGKIIDEQSGIFGLGYFVGGPTLGCAAGRPFKVVGGLFLLCEGRVGFSYVTLPIPDGHVEIWSATLQITVALGWHEF